MTHSITILDDEPLVAQSLVSIVSSTGNACVMHTHPDSALRQIEADRPKLVITDLMMPEMNGLEVLRRVKEIDPEIHVVIVTGYGSVQHAVSAMRAGASDFITKPYKVQEIHDVIAGLMESSAGVGNAEPVDDDGMKPLVLGHHEGYRAVHDRAMGLASDRRHIVISGPEGVGKEALARMMHVASGRAGAFCVLNCAAMPEEAVESELFGREGVWRCASQGTLFLSNSEALPVHHQRALHQRYALERDLPTVPRIIFSTGWPAAEVQPTKSCFEEILRMAEGGILQIPSLKDRAADIPEYAESFLVQLAAKYRRVPPVIKQETLAILHSYDWPGNLTELMQVLERALVLTREPVIGPEVLPEKMLRVSSGRAA